MLVVTSNDCFPVRCKNSVVAIGNFDGFHRAHVRIIDEVCLLSEKYNVRSLLLTFDPHTRIILDPQLKNFLLLPKYKKLELCKELGLDVVYFMDFNSKLVYMNKVKFIEQVIYKTLNIKCLVVGSNFVFGYNGEGSVDDLEYYSKLYDFRLVVVEILKYNGLVCSSSNIRLALKAGDIGNVSMLLGREYEISGIVIEGRKLGRQLGYPTANISMDDFFKPRLGVYEVSVDLNSDGVWLKAIANIGVRPTFGKSDVVVLEVYIPGLDLDLYGRYIKVKLIRFIRDELYFDNVENLKLQMALDVKNVFGE